MTTEVTTQELKTLLIGYAASVNEEIKISLSRAVENVWMQSAIGYHLGWLDSDFRPVPADQNTLGGKKLRPALAILCYQHAIQTVEKKVKRVLPLAAALELIHNYSLVHDDIEDEDRSRRGRETLWARFGKSLAINVGDCLHALAFYALDELRQYGVDSNQFWLLWRRLADTSVKLTLGQHSDLSFQDRLDVTTEMYLKMIEGKTASLMSCATYCGALLALDPTSEVNQMRLSTYTEFGYNLGMGFQIWDDMLGIWGTEQETGKPARGDIRRRKKSLPALFALEHSPQRARLIELYGSTEPITAEQEQFITDALQDCGAREYTERKAAEYKTAALVALNRVTDAPMHAAEDQLRKLVDMMIGDKSR